jgi:L-malate glycosyltransferase
MDRIRILFCIDRLIPGGTEKQLIHLIEHLDRDRFEPHLCTLKPSLMTVPGLDRRDCLEIPFRSFASPYLFSNLRVFRTFLRQHRIDLVQTFFQDPMILAALASLGRHQPHLIGTFRDLGFWRTVVKRCEIRAVLPMYDAFIANAHAVARFFHEADRIPLDKFHVVYNGVASLGDVVPATLPGVGTHTVGIVANFDRPVKRLDLFLDAAKKVLDSGEDADFILIGDGHLRSRLVHQAQTLGILSRVHFLGTVSDPAPYIAALSVGVLCSDSEGLSNAILEYMAAGVPVVASNVGGNPELIQEGVTGLLVPRAGAKALAEAIVRLLRDRTLARTFSAAAKARVRREYSLEQFARNHERVYEQVTECGR